MNLTAVDSQGNTLAQSTLALGPLQHTSFNVFQKFPNLPSNFDGSIRIAGSGPFDYFVAWTLNADSGVLSSLPAGRLDWPISHYERIWLTYQRVYDAAQQFLKPTGVDLGSPPATALRIDYSQVINASASTNGIVQINVALSELISDSPSELAFAIAHELGHIVQYKTGRLAFNTNAEKDADAYGMLFSLLAGYDPYAAAGTLAKYYMASGQAGLFAQFFDNFSGDVHGSFNERLQSVYDLITQVCTSSPQAVSICTTYRNFIHPHFPGNVPLSNPGKLPLGSIR
jgi:hypothetical protein